MALEFITKNGQKLWYYTSGPLPKLGDPIMVGVMCTGIVDKIIDYRYFTIMDCRASSDKTLNDHHQKVSLLEEFCIFLEEHGYTDADWRAEEPYAIDEFLKTKK